MEAICRIGHSRIPASGCLQALGRTLNHQSPIAVAFRYQTFKAALNMATVCLAKQFARTPLVITYFADFRDPMVRRDSDVAGGNQLVAIGVV